RAGRRRGQRRAAKRRGAGRCRASGGAPEPLARARIQARDDVRRGTGRAMTEGPALATTAATVGPFLADKLRALDARLRDVAPRVLASAEDGEAVHDLRVALRRTRTVLEVGRPVLGRFHADEVRRALRAVMQASGALRDDEVLLELIASVGVKRPDVHAWLDARRRRERRLRGALSKTLRS